MAQRRLAGSDVGAGFLRRDSPAAIDVSTGSGARTTWIVASVAPWGFFAVRELAVFELLSILLPLAVGAALLLLGMAFLRRRRLGTAFAISSWAAFGVAAIVGPWLPLGGAPPAVGLRIVAANVAAADRAGDQVQALLDREPDVLVVTELRPEIHRRLAARFPVSVLARHDEPDVAVYSVLPLRHLPDVRGVRPRKSARVEVAAPGGRFVLYALHLEKPGFTDEGDHQRRFDRFHHLVDDVARAVEAEELPTVVAGDLNLVDRSGAYRRLLRPLDDAMRVGWSGPTSTKQLFRPLLLRIDHILRPRSWCAADADRFPIPRSDHLGVAVTVGPCGAS